jgi:hypothetical protein
MKKVLKIKVYDAVQAAVEAGVAYGINRTFKYDEKPEPEGLRERLQDQIEQAVMNELCEKIEF